MVEIIAALNGLTWPGAFALAVLAVAAAYAFVGFVRSIT